MLLRCVNINITFKRNGIQILRIVFESKLTIVKKVTNKIHQINSEVDGKKLLIEYNSNLINISTYYLFNCRSVTITREATINCIVPIHNNNIDDHISSAIIT